MDNTILYYPWFQTAHPLSKNEATNSYRCRYKLNQVYKVEVKTPASNPQLDPVSHSPLSSTFSLFHSPCYVHRVIPSKKLTLEGPLEEKISYITDNLCLRVSLLLNFLQQIKSDGIEVLVEFSCLPGNHGKLGHWQSLAMPFLTHTANKKKF